MADTATMQPDKSDRRASVLRTCTKCGGSVRCTRVREQGGWFGATREYWHECTQCKHAFRTESPNRQQMTLLWSVVVFGLATFLLFRTTASGAGVWFKALVLGAAYGVQGFYASRALRRFLNLRFNPETVAAKREAKAAKPGRRKKR